ncbi:MAG TPA: cysteine--tRNA ligase [Solirubrobacteraceae bacterium]|jgi:cysteinyl-tRNA synthetase|nr:cysteine--tRNA ligase [Solirubrobacteraceae bacterium]
MREIRLHDTRTGKIVPLATRDPGKVGIYACGPTVYSRIHIGNARPFVVFSLLKRFLEHEGYDTTLVVNVTDVNDKIYAAACADLQSSDPSRRIGRPSAELAAEMTALYVSDTDTLGLGRPDHEPLASETMDAIIAYIEDLIDSDHAYVVEYGEEGEQTQRSDVFFRVRSDPEYGSLSHRRIEDMDQGEGVEGSKRKEDPLDFALWKGRKPGEDTWWNAPWGEGRPGWHIECSAMAEGLLGVGFDIHGGGSDLVFPHHENEAAQTRAARGHELATIWMHNGMIQFTGEKMAKSVGNIALLHEVVEQYGRDAVVMYLLGGHYRQPLAFSTAELQDADRRIQRIRDALRRMDPDRPSPSDMAHHVDAFFAALADDYNTPKALASMFEWIREANRRGEAVGDRDLREMLATFALEGLQPLGAVGDLRTIDPEALALLASRETARRERDFARADRLREEINARGWEIRDSADGPELIPLSR